MNFLSVRVEVLACSRLPTFLAPKPRQPWSGRTIIHSLQAAEFRVKAKSVIYLFMHGGPSQVDTFDPKPMLGTPRWPAAAAEFHRLQFQFTDVTRQRRLASQQTFRKCGRAGIDISNSMPQTSAGLPTILPCRACYHEIFNTHARHLNLMNTGSRSESGLP